MDNNESNNILISNIFRLQRKLKIKVNKEIRGVEYYEALQLEVRSRKAYMANSPNLIEIGAILLSAIAFIISSVSFFWSYKLDTSYYFSSTQDGYPVKVGLAKYLIKNPYNESIVSFVTVTYFALIAIVFVIAWLLYRQISLLSKVKKLEILDYYLEKYIKENPIRTNLYSNMNDNFF